jgi:3-methyladenine DNA glycosylase AlkD
MKFGAGSFAGTKSDIKTDILAEADSEKALILAGFFKTADGEYGEGDKFLGITVPKCRKIAGDFYLKLSLDQITKLLQSEWHEERQIALFMLVLQFNKSSTDRQKEIYDIFLDNTKYINNWDLVDCNAPRIVGQYIFDHPSLQPTLDKLAKSDLLWDRRIAVISTLYFIVKGDPEPTMRIVEKLLTDQHDLIQKANGWMLREVGKRVDEKLLIDFLRSNYDNIPRTTLRYAIEKFSPATRTKYLLGQF